MVHVATSERAAAIKAASVKHAADGVKADGATADGGTGNDNARQLEELIASGRKHGILDDAAEGELRRDWAETPAPLRRQMAAMFAAAAQQDATN